MNKPNGTAAFLGLCAVLCVGLAVGAYLTTRGHDSAAFWTSLAALVGILVGVIRTEKVADQVNTIREQTNGANSELRAAALVALGHLPPDQAAQVLRALGVTPATVAPISPPYGGHPKGGTEVRG